MNSVQSKLTEFVEEYLVKIARAQKIGVDTPLLMNSDFDSLFVIELTLFVEREFNINFRQRPIERKNLETLSTLMDFIDNAGAPLNHA